jgi:hypothetical protein
VEYAIRKANQEGLKLNNTHQLLVYADDVNILGTDTHAIKKNAEGIGLEVNAKETKYMGMSQDKNARQSHNIKIGNKSFEGIEQFIYFIMTMTNQNSIKKEIKSRLNSMYVCCHLMHNLLPASFLSKNINIKIYRTVFFFYGCETWLLILREEWRLRVFDK